MATIRFLLLASALLIVSVSSFVVIPCASRSFVGHHRVASAPPLASEADASTETVPETQASSEGEDAQSREIERERYTLFVGNLPFDTSREGVKELFEKWGKVELVALPKNKETQQHRGFAFVDMSSAEELDAAVSGCNGYILGNRELRVSKSLSKEERETLPPKEKKTRTKPAPSVTENGMQKIYVGNLPFYTNKEDLLSLYEQYGTVSDVFIPMNSETNKGRGFAFVTMKDEDCQKAIDATNGIDFQGRALVVNKPLAPGEKASNRRSTRMKLYVGNLAFYTVAETLKEIFEEFGTVYDCYLPEDSSTGGTRGFGFITMDREDAMNAINELDGCKVDGRVIRVNESRPKNARGDDDGDVRDAWMNDEE